MKKIRLLIISNIISPYRVSLFNILNSFPELEIFVLYVAKTESNRQWKIDESTLYYKHFVLPGLHWAITRDKTLHLSWNFGKIFNSFQPDVLFLGTDILGSSVSWFALALARWCKIPVIRYEARHCYTPWVNNRIKNFLFGFFIKKMDRYFVYSKLTRDYLVQNYHIAQDRIDIGYNVGDSDFFIKSVQSFLNTPDYVKIRLQYPPIMLLFTGHLDDGKNIIGLLEILEEIAKVYRGKIGLFIAGDGPLKKTVHDTAKCIQLMKIFPLGFLQKEELAQYFALSEIFVLPTKTDAASISLSEALHSGLYVLGSKYDGSSSNFIQNGVNGLIFDPLNKEEFAAAAKIAIEKLLIADKKNLKREIQETVSEYTIHHYAKRLLKSVIRTYTAN